VCGSDQVAASVNMFRHPFFELIQFKTYVNFDMKKGKAWLRSVVNMYVHVRRSEVVDVVGAW